MNAICQDSTASSGPDFRNRKLLVGGISAAGYAGSLLLLNEAWYKNYPKSSFHTFNDAAEWLQVDKLGHGWTAYNTSRATTAMWQWAGYRGASKQKAIWLGSISGFTYLTVIEVLDGHSANWGWSWADVGANAFGTALFAGQELLWDEQRIQYKFSSHRNRYDHSLEPRADKLFGGSLPERLLKDYNAQTYWLSINMRSILPKTKLPPWLNIAVGYGATGLWGGFDNKAYDAGGNIIFDRQDIPRQRQWYLSPDIDFTKIKTRSAFVRTILSGLNALKFPAPALELTGKKIRLRGLYF